MIKAIFPLLALMVLLTLSGCGGPSPQNGTSDRSYTVTDVQGTVVKLSHKPQKILTYSYTFDGMLLGLVPPERMAAVNQVATESRRSWAYREAAKVPVKVKYAYGALPAEQVLSLKPDLIVASTWTKPEAVKSLRDLGFPVVVCKGPTSIEEVKDTLRLIAKAVQEEEAGARIIAEMDKRLSLVDERLGRLHRKKPSGLLISMMSSYGGTGSMYDALCTRAHIVNSIAAAGLKNGEKLTKEAVVRSNPDFFLVSEIKENDMYSYERFKQEFIRDPALKGLKGLHNIKALPERSFYNATQNCVYSVMELANAAYGETFDMSKAQFIKGY